LTASDHAGISPQAWEQGVPAARYLENPSGQSFFQTDTGPVDPQLVGIAGDVGLNSADKLY